MNFKQKIKKYYLVLLAIIVVIFFNLATIMPAEAEEEMLRTLTVTGQGKEIVATSLTQINMAVQVEGKTAKEVQQQVAQQTSSLIALLRSRQVEKLQTTGVQLQPNYDYSRGERKPIGYIGSNQVSFRLKTTEVGSLLDDAVEVGANRIDSISFTATDDVLATAQKEAIRKAVEEAQSQANAVFSTLDLQAKEIVKIQINGANVPQMRQVQVEAFSQKDSVSTPIIGGEQTVTASVTLQISY